MGTEFWSNEGYTITTEALQAIVGPELHALNFCIEALGEDLDSFASQYSDDDFQPPFDECYEEICELVNKVCEKFEAETGLEIYLEYVGDSLRGSDLEDTHYWVVIARGLLPEAKDIERHLVFFNIQQCG